MAGVDEAYKKLEKEGHNTVDNLIKWMQEAQVIERTEAAEKKAREAFKEVVKTGNVTLDNFKEVVGKLAVTGSKTVDAFMAQLAGGLQTLADIAKDAATSTAKK